MSLRCCVHRPQSIETRQADRASHNFSPSAGLICAQQQDDSGSLLTMAVQADWPAAVDILFKAGARVPKYITSARARYCFITALPQTHHGRRRHSLVAGIYPGGGTDDRLSNACNGSDRRLPQVGAGDAGAQKLLTWAAAHCGAACVKLLASKLKRRPSRWVDRRSGRVPLHAAAEAGREENAAVLIKQGFSVSAKDKAR